MKCRLTSLALWGQLFSMFLGGGHFVLPAFALYIVVQGKWGVLVSLSFGPWHLLVAPSREFSSFRQLVFSFLCKCQAVQTWGLVFFLRKSLVIPPELTRKAQTDLRGRPGLQLLHLSWGFLTVLTPALCCCPLPGSPPSALTWSRFLASCLAHQAQASSASCLVMDDTQGHAGSLATSQDGLC